MLQEGEIVKIGEESYKVQRMTAKDLPCLKCQVRCSSREFDDLKASNMALSCLELIPSNTYFVKVEQ